MRAKKKEKVKNFLLSSDKEGEKVNPVVDMICSVYSEAIKKKETKKSNDIKIIFKNDASTVKKIDISDIKSTKRTSVNSDLFKWNNFDFAIYFIDKYNKIYDGGELNRLAIVRYLDNLHDRLIDVVGFCDNLVMLDYLDFFISRWLSFLIKKQKKGFILRFLVEEDALNDFMMGYNYAKSKEIYKKKNNYEKKSNCITSKMLSDSLLLGYENLFLEYGILGPVNWLIMSFGIDAQKAQLKAVEILKKLADKKELHISVGATNKLNPYPDWFVIKNCDIIFDLLKKEYFIVIDRLKVSITFLHNENSWKFKEEI